MAGERLPAAELPAGRLLVEKGTVFFTWELIDADMSTRGDGVARLASPDSARLDFFLLGGLAGGRAALVGDTLRAPGGNPLVRRLIPPTPLLWGAVGRLSTPSYPDTNVARDGALVRGDIGLPVAWRVTFMGDSLTRLERVSGGRVVEWVERQGERIRYRNETARRELRLSIERTESAFQFDEAIWNP